MKNTDRNVWVIAENNPGHDGFNIYLDFSGQREYLMSHRHCGFTYSVLKDGIRLSELKRIITGNTMRYGYPIQKYRKPLQYLIGTIDSYISEEHCA